MYIHKSTHKKSFFIYICEEVEIVYVMDDVVPLYDYIKNNDLSNDQQK